MYGFVTVLSRGASFIMLPVYTRYLQPADYGVLQMLDLAVEVTVLLFVAGMTAGLQQYYFAASTERDRRSVIATAFAMEVGAGLVAAIALALAAPAISAGLLGGNGSAGLVRIAGANFALGVLVTMPLLVFQMLQRSEAFILASLAKLALQLSLNVLFLVGLGMGVRGILLSTLIANAVVGVGCAIWLLRHCGFRPRWDYARLLRRFGAPYQLTFIGGFILTYADRFFLEHSHGVAAVGIYGLAYQFGFLLVQLSSGPFLAAWTPHRYHLLGESSEARDAKVAAGFFYLNLLLVTAGLGIVAFIRPILGIMTTEAFHVAAPLVPLVVIAYALQAWTYAVKFGLDVSERTGDYTRATWVAVAVTVAAYALLIPPYGAAGAAWATVIGFTVRFALVQVLSHRAHPVDYHWRRPALLVACATATGGTAFVLAPGTLLLQVATGVAALLAYGVAVWVVVLGEPERSVLRSVARTPQRAAQLLFAAS